LLVGAKPFDAPPAFAGELYPLLGTLGATSPGFPLLGATLHHAFGVLDLAGPSVELVSNPVRLDLVP
jgi:hypothetical protein